MHGADEFYVDAFIRDNPVRQLFQRLSRVLQSSKHLLFSTWTVTVDRYRHRTGGAPNRQRPSIQVSKFLDLEAKDVRSPPNKDHRAMSDDDALVEVDCKHDELMIDASSSSPRHLAQRAPKSNSSFQTHSSPSVHLGSDIDAHVPSSSNNPARTSPHSKRVNRRKKGLNLWCYKVLNNKRCVIKIVNPEDQLCLHRAVVVSLAYQQ